MNKSVIFFAFAAICATNAIAEEQSQASQRLDPIVVTAARVPQRPSGSLFGTTILQSSKSVDVITQEDIKRSPARTVPELLKGRVGVCVKEYTGNGKTAQVDIRGFGETAPSNVLVLIDGRRANQNDISGTDWLQIDVDSVERIEIVRGPQSVLYGDNAVGGVINIITKRG
ncbi:MAG TPA: TonB-dependent receptor plug domain-containing protein, partial [Candidatus Omnitrophota bacterium]|nr:TonB-dependent receptor plug domain-containing protein [Candidatus Omnitrophota bacterium]